MAATPANTAGADDLEAFDASQLTGAGAQPDQQAAPKDSLPALEMKPLPVPIAKRKPAQPLNEKQKAEWSAKNLELIGHGVQRYIAKNKFIPYRNVKSSTGSMVLSWRVMLLPYLGYQELYERFNLEEPWDSPHNVRLLSYIPDVYVSPERFDWQTNWLGMAGNGYALGTNDLEFVSADPWADTVLMVEANDSQAVPWTKPQDYLLTDDKIKLDLGSQRALGIFSIWGDGSIGLIPASTYWADLHAACTVEGAENQPASKIKRAVRLDDDLEAFEDNIKLTEKMAPTVTPEVKATVQAKPVEPELPRDAVPTAQQIKSASEGFRRLFAEKLANAQDSKAKAALAQELLATSHELTDDPTGAYVLLLAAGKLANDCGNIDLLLQAVDGRVSRFDVNSLVENHEALATFGNLYKDRSAAEFDGSSYLKRSLYVIFGLCMEDDYTGASNLLRHTIHFLDYPKPIR